MLPGTFNKTWQGQSNKTLRSVDATGPWLLKQRGGEFMKLMCSIVGSLCDATSCKTMGFTFPRNNGAAVIDAGEVLFQDNMAGLAARYHLQLAGNRIVRQYQLLRGWPWGACMMLSDNAEVVAEAMNLLKSDYEHFLELGRRVTAGAAMTFPIWSQ